MTKVIWQPKALKQLIQIGDRIIQACILDATRDLAVFSDMGDIKKLVNHENSYRMRVGSWRILFNAFKEISAALGLNEEQLK